MNGLQIQKKTVNFLKIIQAYFTFNGEHANSKCCDTLSGIFQMAQRWKIPIQNMQATVNFKQRRLIFSRGIF